MKKSKNSTLLNAKVSDEQFEKWNEARIKFKFWRFYTVLAEKTGVDVLLVRKAFNKRYGTPDTITRINSVIEKL